MKQEELTKHLHEALNSVDITFPYRYVLVEAIEALSQPSLPEGLEEAAEKYANRGISSNADPYEETIAYRADKDAFIAGAEWSMNQCPLPEDTTIFMKGVAEGKRLMLEEAVEGEICGRVYDHINVRFADGVCKYLDPKNISHIPADVSKFKVGDKVRVIVIPNTDEK